MGDKCKGILKNFEVIQKSQKQIEMKGDGEREDGGGGDIKY